MTSTMDLHCPKCAGDMATYERSGITVDQCRECRGIFLDRGELEKLVDAEGGGWAGPQPVVPAQADRGRGTSRPAWHDDDDRDDRRGIDPRGSYGSYGSYERPSKKRSFLGDLLEGFGD